MNATHSELMGLDTIVDWHIGFSSSTKNLAGFIFGDIVGGNGGIPTRLETGNPKWNIYLPSDTKDVCM